MNESVTVVKTTPSFLVPYTALTPDTSTAPASPQPLPTSIGVECRTQLEEMGIELPPEKFYCTCFKICLDRTLSPEEKSQQQEAMLELMAVSHGHVGVDTIVMIVMYSVILVTGLVGTLLRFYIYVCIYVIIYLALIMVTSVIFKIRQRIITFTLLN